MHGPLWVVGERRGVGGWELREWWQEVIEGEEPKWSGLGVEITEGITSARGGRRGRGAEGIVVRVAEGIRVEVKIMARSTGKRLSEI